MFSNCIARFIHTNKLLWQSASSKSLLSELRKKTGYTFSNCKKALELNENNLEKAEEWLKAEAQSQGWAKAEKLKSRATSQGLIAVSVSEQYGSMVEINCETDFVAKNKEFQNFSKTVANAVLDHTKTLQHTGLINKVALDSEALKALPTKEGASIAECAALTIGRLGENLNIKRALCIRVSPYSFIAGCTHPGSSYDATTTFGKYGALIVYKIENNDNEEIEEATVIGKKLCQHIIGAHPIRLGEKHFDVPHPIPEEETVFIYQEFLLDPNLHVYEYMRENKTKVYDFARFELGEVLEGQQSLDTVETAG